MTLGEVRTGSLLARWSNGRPLLKVLVDGVNVSVVERAVFSNKHTVTVHHINAIIELQPLANAVAKMLHKSLPGGVVSVGGAIDDEVPGLVAVFVEVSLNIVGHIKVPRPVRCSLRPCFGRQVCLYFLSSAVVGVKCW